MLIVCAHCLTTNRVPSERAAQDPTCGHCHKPLLDGHPAVLDDRTFDAVAGKTELPVVVDFWASWCGPCLQMAPQFETAAQQLKGHALFVKIDSDASPQLSARFGIRSIPTLLLLKAGKEHKRQAGATQAAQIVNWVQAA
ncbi:MAG: thiol reductase thioredoxin [Rhizobacter sp.]|nr:thiol reductase thioredoxin [Rhizobacter sp.]